MPDKNRNWQSLTGKYYNNFPVAIKKKNQRRFIGKPC